MKKLLSAAFALCLTVCVSISAFAAQSSISVKNNVVSSKPVTYNYDSENSGEVVKSIKSLMTKLDLINKQSGVVQTLTVTSTSNDKKKVNVKLRLSLPEKKTSVKPEAVSTPSPDEVSALDYYNIKVTSAGGDVIYDYQTAEANTSKTYKDIPLGTLNDNKGYESRIYNVSISQNANLDKDAISKNAKNLDWSIVTDTYSEQAAPEVTAAPSAMPSAPSVTENPSAPTQLPSATKAPTSAPSRSSSAVDFKSGEYTVGDDIKAGRYTMTGEGKVHVYTPEGVLKTTIALKPKSDNSSNGVSEYVINLENGQKINVENSARFTPYTQASSSPRPSATPKASSSPKPSATPRTTVRPTSSPSTSSKSNPKTGDELPLVGIGIIGAASLAGVIFIGIKKRKNNK